MQEKAAVEMDALYVDPWIPEIAGSYFLPSFKQDAGRPPELKVIAEICTVIDVLSGDFK